MRRLWIVQLLMLLALGCKSQPYELAPVSGKVTLNGKPLPKAWVHFAPMASQGNPNPGPTSHGETDAGGNFRLMVDPDHPGAVVGKSRVFISTLDVGAGKGEDIPDAGGKIKIRERVPKKYNQETKLTFDIPPGGTDQANFDLKAP